MFAEFVLAGRFFRNRPFPARENVIQPGSGRGAAIFGNHL